MMDNTSWMAPPGAAQPSGIQSTAGAVPVVNEKGEISMKKVKVSRYISGKRPDYAPVLSDDEVSDTEDFTLPRGHGSPPPHKSMTEAELQDSRLRRLQGPHFEGPQQRGIAAEVVEVSESEDEDVVKPAEFSRAIRVAESDSESEGEVDEDELVQRRQRMRERALNRAQEEQEVMGKEEEGSEESSEEESSEYTEESDSEEEGPRLKPVFVRKRDRVTIHQKELEYNKERQQEIENKKRAEERRRETLRMIESEHRQAQTTQSQSEGGEKIAKADEINTDDEADDAEYESWKLRELKRIKRDKEEREQTEKEKEELERLRNMTEDERRLALRNNPKVVTNKAVKGKYKFMQKYYHRGAFFLNEEEHVYKRDFSGATLEDHFDKTILPKVMQVKNFGRSGRTKYTHLVDQDTTTFDSAWFAESQLKNKFSSTSAGGMKQIFERPSAKRKRTTADSYPTKK